MMVLDPKIAGIISGVIMVLVGVLIPTEFDVANQMNDELKQLHANPDWCGENIDCKKIFKTSIRNLETSLSAIEFTNNMSSLFFWFGLLTSGGSIFALVKSKFHD